MSGSFEKSVKGGTKIKLAPPKAKYVEHILVATHAGDAGVAEIFRVLQYRLRDSTWTIVFKSLIIVHLMVREGEPDVTLKYLADSPSKLAISNFSDVQVQGTNIRHYYSYILARAKAFKDTRIDWVRQGVGRLKRQTVDKGLLRETETVQNQINSLLKCDLLSSGAENEITVCAFRLLTMDLLVLYGVMNEGTINVLEHYFEMSQYDAQRALNIYKTFTKQTNLVVEFLGVARQYENATRLEIPKLKHAPTSLTASLEEYLNDPDFEVNRRQYLVQQDAKKGKKPGTASQVESSNASRKPAVNSGSKTTPMPEAKAVPHTETASGPPKGPAPDLIDFFESIEQNQLPMAVQSQQAPNFQATQQTGFQPQQIFQSQNGQQPTALQMNGGVSTNPFGQPSPQQPFQQTFTGAGFSGYNSQLVPGPSQDIFSNVSQTTGSSFPPQQQPFSTGQTSFTPSQQPFNTGQQSQQPMNPFRQSMFPNATGASLPSYPQMPPTQSPQSTNPFARNATMPISAHPSGSPFTSPAPQVPPQPQTQQLRPQRTGTNPFAKSTLQTPQSQHTAQPVTVQPIGSTNPFRQSMFVNQQTGQGWPADQGSMGGMEQLPTIPVFPRPGQQPQQSPWL